MWSTPAVWKQYNKIAVLHFFLVNSSLYILFSMILSLLRPWSINCYPSNNFTVNPRKSPRIFPGNPRKFPEILHRKIRWKCRQPFQGISRNPFRGTRSKEFLVTNSMEFLVTNSAEKPEKMFLRNILKSSQHIPE